VKAGAAAGMKVLGFCAHTPKEMLLAAGAHLTFERMSVLPKLVRDA
jgi:beta-phosphoglucomutase-like phosphatase (HAD superfamily)